MSALLPHLRTARTPAELVRLSGLPHPEVVAELRRLGRAVEAIKPTTIHDRAIRYRATNEAPRRDPSSLPRAPQGRHHDARPDPASVPELEPLHAGEVGPQDAGEVRPADDRGAGAAGTVGAVGRQNEPVAQKTRSAAGIRRMTALLSKYGPMPRSDIARLLNVSVGKIGHHARAALGLGVVIVAGHTVSRTGGPPIELIGLPSQQMPPLPVKPASDLVAFIRRGIVIGGRASVRNIMSAAKYAGLPATIREVKAAIEQITAEGKIARVRSNYLTNQKVWAYIGPPRSTRPPVTRDDVRQALAAGALATADICAALERSPQRIHALLSGMRRDRLVTYSDRRWRLVEA